MKRIFLLFTILSLFVSSLAMAQGGHNISGLVIDSTKLSVPGATVKLKTEKGDSTIRVTGLDGKFLFTGVNSGKVTITITSIGYEGVIKHLVLENDNKPFEMGNVLLKSSSKMLSGVTIVGITPVKLKEDTVQYSAAAYKVRENSPVEDLVKKLPGVDVDADGTITTKGKQITKIRINGKDVFGGDVASITKNLPADVVENIQMIDDYGDQANLTGIKTGEPNQIMNITIRQDKNYGYSLNATGGAGRDMLPAPQPEGTRYEGLVNSFAFHGDRQISVLANLNNVNANTFSFGGNNGGGGGGGRGGNGAGSPSSNANGITDVHTGGINYRDQWGKKLAVYGSYSVADNTLDLIQSSTQTSNTAFVNGNNTASTQTVHTVNHRFTWNMEYRPDTLNYLKITPNFSYSSSTTNYNDEVFRTLGREDSTGNMVVDTTHYTSTKPTTSTSPSYDVEVLYNHKFFATGRNLNIYSTFSSNHSNQTQNPIYNYISGPRAVNPDQLITTGSRVTSYGTSLSYLEPLSKLSYLELNYAFNHSHTTSDKYTQVADVDSVNIIKAPGLVPDPDGINDYSYNFTTNKIGLNYRFIEQKYNYTLGVGVQPAVLDGYSPSSKVSTHITTFNVIPTARYIYNFSQNSSFSANYNGSSSQPSFDQLQPVIDYSNATYPVQGNPNLKPSFTNNFSVRYNFFSFDTGDTFFLNARFSQVNNSIVSNSITYQVDDPTNIHLKAGNTLSKYLNASGYYTGDGRFSYSKPWDNRKFTLSFNGRITYTNNVGYISAFKGADSLYNAKTNRNDTITVTQQNISKNLQFAPGIRFRVDIDNVIDAQLNTTYTINKTDNSVKTDLTQAGADVRTLLFAVQGRNYFWNNWTLSYDYSRSINYGYTQKVTNPNILNLYVERRFLKNNLATIRLAAYDIFNQNAGYSATTNSNFQTETSVNRLGRYFLATLTINLKRFAGKAPSGPDDLNNQDGNGRRRRNGDGNGNGGGRGRGGNGGGGGRGGF
jgi:hypothetical protein